jgi:class 3 adenylate cyclase/predicted ATPase
MNDRSLQDWLAALGLARYATLFTENAIDCDVLADLTDADLTGLGIPLGHRKKLLRAIRSLPTRTRGMADALPPDGPVPPPTFTDNPAQSPSPMLVDSRAERRQLTVMFCDMVGSTELANTLDPEDMLEVLQRYQRAAAGQVAEYGGNIAQYLGDGILAYFGFPQAHEDDAERAVRAALGIVEAIGPLNATLDRSKYVEVAIRIGIATGLVVVGNIIGDAGAEERTAIGETPNLAARLQTIAAPNTVVIADSTVRLLGARFEYEDLGSRQLAGFRKPQKAWRVVRAVNSRSRFEAQQRYALSPFIGREHEMRLIIECWRRVLSGAGQVLLICGEPGIGKSRLTLAFEQAIAADRHDDIHFCCSPFHRNSALHPITERLKRAAEFDAHDDDDARLDKLADLIGSDVRAIERTLPLLASLISLKGCNRPVLSDVSAQKQKDLTLATLVDLLQVASRKTPQLVVFEDLQWIDPTSLELLELLVERVAGHAILVVATHRPEFLAPWTGQLHVTALILNRLNHARTKEFVRALLDGKELPEPVLSQIVAKTGGVPLFVEELTKTVLESGLVRAEHGRYVLDGPLPKRAIPATIHDSLMSRLDQLALPKEVAQIGSVIGRRFPYDLLAVVTGLPEAILLESLDRLVASGLVFSRGTPPRSAYVFKHALIQDAAYESLLLSRRRSLHQRIARMIETRFSAAPWNSPELIAHHYTEAGDFDRAAVQWLAAANAAGQASAYQEAVNSLRRGLSVIDNLPVGPHRVTRELELQLPLGAALIACTGAGSPDVEAVYARALALCERLPESPLHFAAFWGWWRISMDFRTGHERADCLLTLSERLADPSLVLQAHHCLWASNFMLGDHRKCLEHVSQGLALYDAEAHAALASMYGGHDTKVCGDGEAALSLWLLGFADEAQQRAERAIDWARQLGHAGSIAHALDYAVVLNRYRQRPDTVVRLADELIRFAEERGLSDHIAKGTLFRGWAMAMQGDTEGGVRDMNVALAAQKASGTPEDFPVYYDMLAEAFFAAGRYDDGLAQIDEAMAIGTQSGICYWDSELFRRKGMLLSAAGYGTSGEAETCLSQALAVARQQGARSLELRAAITLSRLWRRQGRPAAARELLLPVSRWFPETTDNAELLEARDLMRELS